jgi:hypothetical protein
MKLFTLIAAIGIAASELTGCVAHAGYFVASSPPRSPPARVEYVPPPRPGQVWVQGSWRWAGNRYQWVPGRWARRPRRFARWEQGRWVRQPRGWVWVEGHWRG